MASKLEVPWGRLLIAGGTDFATLGRKDKAGKSYNVPERPELPTAQIMRPVANIKFKRVITSHSSCHTVVLDIKNRAWLFGRNEHHQLSYPLPLHLTFPHLSVDGTPSATPAASFPFLLNNLPDSNVPRSLKSQEIISAATGRGHTILITKEGEAWSAGWNYLGQCGQPGGMEHVSSFMRVGGPLLREKVVEASAGVTFSLFLTESGKVFAVGSGEKGQLGNGKTGEHIAASKVFFTEQTEPLQVRGPLEGKKIVQISSGQQHSVALDDEGFCYSWGFGGLGRLGLGAQYDALVPTVIPNFAGPNPLTRATKIAAGGTNTLFIDAQGMVSLCGKWKTSGDGSSGQPWMFPKLVQDIMGYKWQHISAGGVTLFASTYDPKEGEFVVGWGQGASYGELGLGAGSVRSATKPTRIDPLDAISILDISAGQNTTFFIARPPPTQATVEAVKEAIAEAVPAEPVATTSSTGGGQPAIDLSGFGFDFGPPKPAAAAAAATAPVMVTGEGEDKITTDDKKLDVSRTDPDAWEELLRYPAVLDAVDSCQVCGKEEGESEALECEMCELAYHGACLSPPVIGIPDGEWFCPSCDPIDEDDDEDSEEEVTSKKRKAGDSQGGLKKKKV